MVGTAHFFEGVEKLVEVWFSAKDNKKLNCDLRNIPRSQLEALLEIVKCEIVSSASTEYIDAYVLSESSMFISKERFILKTCGTTTPLDCLPFLFGLVQEYAGFDLVENFFYSRKNFKRPELQLSPHENFEKESKILDHLFPNKGGRAYCLGSLNGEDCWYLYIVSSRSTKNKQLENSLRANNRVNKHDQTLEVLMTDVDQDKMKYFFKENFPSAVAATKLSGIADLIPNMTIDDFQFDPCGYSMNGVSRAIEGGYMTIHITPEPQFSYVSFETNIPHKNYRDLVYRVVKLFEPKQFVVTFFSTEGTRSLCNTDDDSNSEYNYEDYYVDDLQMCRLPGYDLFYALYNRFPS